MPDSPRQRVVPQSIWLVIFTDLVALLLAFFVLLYSMSDIRLDGWHTLVDAFAEKLGPTAEHTDPALVETQNIERQFETDGIDIDYLDTLLRQQMAQDVNLVGSVQHRLDDRIVLSLPTDLLFGSGRSEVTERAQNVAKSLVNLLSGIENRIEIIGHTDPNPVSEASAYASNWSLSLARATAFANALMASGLQRQPIVYGLADSRYYDISNALPTEQRDGLARRVDLVIRQVSAEGGDDG